MAGVERDQKGDLVLYCGKCRKFYALQHYNGVYHGKPIAAERIEFHTMPFVVE
jgi:hypothetical protein